MDNHQEEKSRTQIKKEALDLQKIGEKLINLSPEQLAALGIPIELEEAVLDAKSISSNQARRRQIQYIGALMRAIDPQPLLSALERIKAGVPISQPNDTHSRRAQDLIQGDDGVFDEILEHSPIANRQKLSQLVRNARKNQDGQKSSKTFKALITYLKELDRT